jgi:cytochrome c oxidase subunit 2
MNIITVTTEVKKAAPFFLFNFVNQCWYFLITVFCFIFTGHFLKNNFSFMYFYDFPSKGQLGFQDPASPVMEGIIDLHHDLMFFLVIIIIFVVWLLFSTVYYFYLYDDKDMREIHSSVLIPSVRSFNVLLEIVWTIVPCVILLMIAIPSFALLYSMDELLTPVLTLKIIGHQWYWTYQYDHVIKHSFFDSNNKSQFLISNKEFDSNMLLDEDLKIGQLRLLEVNKRTMLPVKTNLRLLVTSADVLHSWAVPSLGIKLDACPGRLNQAPLYVKREGIFYGQCSEICGVNHAFMPIAIKAVESGEFLDWFSKGFNAALDTVVSEALEPPKKDLNGVFEGGWTIDGDYIDTRTVLFNLYYEYKLDKSLYLNFVSYQDILKEDLSIMGSFKLQRAFNLLLDSIILQNRPQIMIDYYLEKLRNTENNERRHYLLIQLIEAVYEFSPSPDRYINMIRIIGETNGYMREFTFREMLVSSLNFELNPFKLSDIESYYSLSKIAKSRDVLTDNDIRCLLDDLITKQRLQLYINYIVTKINSTTDSARDMWILRLLGELLLYVPRKTRLGELINKIYISTNVEERNIFLEILLKDLDDVKIIEREFIYDKLFEELLGKK